MGFVELKVPQFDMKEKCCMFEGKDGELEFVCGIVTGKENKILNRNQGEKRVTVKKDEKIGYGLMLVEGLTLRKVEE